MSAPITESFRALQRIGADAFGDTGLAADVGPTVRRVGRRRVGRAVGTVAAAVALVAAVTVGALGYTGRTVSPGGPTPTPTASVDVELANVVVNRGDTGTEIARTLRDAGVIASVEDFVKVAEEHPDESRRIAPGYYALPKGMEPYDAMLALLDPARRQGPNITVREGITAEQILGELHDKLSIPIADLEAAAADPEALGLPAEANGNLEGWLGTYTYYFDPGTTATDALSAMVSATIAKLDEEGVAPGDRMRVLTVASLIEREVKLDVDRPKIARVIENRLAADMPLHLDSTRQYALWAEDWVHQSRGGPAANSPYDTTRVMGLPPAPIASPGEASIDAALHPADGTWLYFVMVNLETGETRYATTYEEDIANVDLLLAWLEANPAWTDAHGVDTFWGATDAGGS